METQTIDHFVLTVASIEATCAFYVEALGMEVITFQGDRKALGFGDHKINLHPIGADLTPKAAAPMPGSGDFCLISKTPIDDVVRHLQDLGIEILDGPLERTGAKGVIRSVYVRDPDGNLVEVSEYL